ncbi:MAG: sigma 54-interacting transcriptional regulator [Deltaproteobacteria bacterium]|nr:sigma 54-interacting transcriptional regulator [Deltaproteobacteria bacterium]
MVICVIIQAMQKIKTKDMGRQMHVTILGHPTYVSRLTRFFEVIGASDGSLLLTGPFGCGKEVWLDYVIANSKRSQQAIIKVNCAELTESDATREIFADTAESLLGQAQGGTLVLDELRYLPVSTQASLGKFLEDRKVMDRRTGESRFVDTRIMAMATDRKALAPMLTYRFAYRVSIPPLAGRKEDIPYLLKGLLRDSSIRYVRYIALLKLFYNRWGGNVRELKSYLAQTMAYYQSTAAEKFHAAGLWGEASTRYFQDVFAEETWYYDYNFEEDFQRYFSEILTRTTFREEIINEGLVVPLEKKDASYLALNIWEEDFEEKAWRIYRKFADYLEKCKTGISKDTGL